MSDEKYVAKLTTGESRLLLSSCAVTGAVFGIMIYFSKALSLDSFYHQTTAARTILCFYLLVPFLGPGTCFGFFGRFGVRGAERRAFMRGAWWQFNALAWGVGFLVFALLYTCHLLWP